MNLKLASLCPSTPMSEISSWTGHVSG
uniref:Uncharacterized protein n=1 Tax=Rhizophora mucronata TaxID=61149 RepID=A0A2P2NQ64_RHIMU